MKLDPNAPAFPPLSVRAPGIDVRAYIATKIMASLANTYNRNGVGQRATNEEAAMAHDAVRLTDALIERLNKEQR